MWSHLLIAAAILASSGLAQAQYAQTSDTASQPGSSVSDCSDLLMADQAQCGQSGQGELGIPPAANSSLPLTPDQLQAPGRNGRYVETAPNDRPMNGHYLPLPLLLPPEPLTEFQKFTASTTGQILPIFGADLFRRVPNTFAPLNETPVPANYGIGPGDEIRIRVWGQVNFQADVYVGRNGDIYLPQVGIVHVAGLPYSGLDAHLHSAIGRIYRNFNLTADLGQIRAIEVYVTGEARRPGMYTISSLSTLVDALFASGGPSIEGSLRHLQLRRGAAIVTDFDLYDLLVRGDKSKDVQLQSGDVLFIPPVGSQVAITGSVRNPAIYEVRGNETLKDLIEDAGGATAMASGGRVSIERIENHEDRVAMEVAYNVAGLATPLSNGDLIRVYSIVPKYSNTVTLRGNTANPGRFAWHPGMRLSDLIPDRESLITRNYWWRRAQLGLPAPEFEPMEGWRDRTQPIGQYPINVKMRPAMEQMQQSGASGQTGQQQGAGNLNQPATEDQQDQDSYNLARLRARQQAGAAALAQQENNTSLAAQATPKTLVALLAPDIDWNYAVIERQDPENLKTTLIPFDLGRLVLQHDASQNLALRPGDVVTVFSAGDIRLPLAEQTKLVTLEGEFVHAGVYSALPGETLRHLVERAGGVTPNAYLYGSDFTRNSTRLIQQTRIDEYVQSLGTRIQRSTLSLVSSPTSSAQDMAASNAIQNNEQQLLARLGQVRATGRIVLNLKPDSSGVSSLPDLPLENGDKFVIPHVPATVNVIGAVYDQSSFLVEHGRRVDFYLKSAGGPNGQADTRHEFIIRADGEVVSRETVNGLWNDGFRNLRVNPGDTIVIPEKTFTPSVLKSVLNWSQVFSQLALGAAAINVLR
jgi:protein involved in polysaccharide export with SLBB domain